MKNMIKASVLVASVMGTVWAQEAGTPIAMENAAPVTPVTETAAPSQEMPTQIQTPVTPVVTQEEKKEIVPSTETMTSETIKEDIQQMGSGAKEENTQPTQDVTPVAPTSEKKDDAALTSQAQQPQTAASSVTDEDAELAKLLEELEKDLANEAARNNQAAH